MPINRSDRGEQRKRKRSTIFRPSLSKNTMNFHNVNEFNVLVNCLSGNFFPLDSTEGQFSIIQKVYSVGTILFEVIYLFLSLTGFFFLPILEAIQGGTVNLVVLIEVLSLTFHMNFRRTNFCLLIKKINLLLNVKSNRRKNFIYENIHPIMVMLKLYTIAAVGSVIIWISLPGLKVLKKNSFKLSDFSVPMYYFFDGELGVNHYFLGLIFQAIGSGYTILKKVAIDIYIIHFITLLTAQYLHLQDEFARAFDDDKLTSEECIRDNLKELILYHGRLIK